MNRYYCKLNFSHSVARDELPYDTKSMTRVQRDGKLTNSNVTIPSGTKYSIYKKNHLSDGSIEFSVKFIPDNRIEYSADYHYDNEEDARNDGWNI